MQARYPHSRQDLATKNAASSRPLRLMVAVVTRASDTFYNEINLDPQTQNGYVSVVHGGAKLAHNGLMATNAEVFASYGLLLSAGQI
jgi:hypothetical protein